MQERKLEAILNHAYQNVPFYKGLFDSAGVKPGDIKTVNDLSKIPTVTKSEIRNAGREITAKNVDLNNCVEHRTSGSTGTPLELLFTKEDTLYATATYDRARVENGLRLYRDSTLIVGFQYIPKGKTLYQRLGIRRREGCNIFDSMDVQLSVLQRAKPDVILGYPSGIKLLAKAMQERDVKGIYPRFISTASEVLDPDTRKFVSSVFNAEIFDVYGAYETGCMAWECSEQRGYHMSMDTVIMEFVDKNGERVAPGERGEVIVTNLHSYAMPIIRYRIGDYAIPTDEECPCGRGGYLIKAIEGRCDDFIKLPGGQSISSLGLTTIMEFVAGVEEFQIVQEKKDELTIYVVKKEGFEDSVICNQIDDEFKKVLGKDINTKPEIVREIARERSGKLRAVISKL
jgi:phenylacetate-CoA ligase